MGVDKSDVLKKMREAEAIYVLMSDCTRMPFVVCDPETYDDQVLIFFSEEEAMKGGQEFLKEGNPLKIFNIENKYMLSLQQFIPGRSEWDVGRKRYRRRDQASTYRTGQKTGAETGRGTDRESEFPDYSYVLHAGST